MTFPVAPVAPRDRVETLLRERKLDRTLTTTLPGSLPGKLPGSLPGKLLGRVVAEAVAAFGLATLDARGGGLPRGHVSELIGPVSSGRTSLAWMWLGAATARGEAVALVDTFDRFDPATAVACGVDLTRLLWVRGQAITKTAGAVDPAWLPGARTVEGPGTLLERTIDRSLKALNLVLQSGVCTAVVLDFVDVPLAGIRRVPLTTWRRLQRIVEGTDIACLLTGPVPLARSAGGLTITTGPPSRPKAASAFAEAPADRRSLGGGWSARSRRSSPEIARAEADAAGRARWSGDHDRSRRLAGLSITSRMSSPRRTVEGVVTLDTTTRNDAWAVE